MRIDGYEIAGEIGRGGMASVYKARDGAGRNVAIKVLTTRLSERADERFLREGRLTAALSHPAIVRVHGYGKSDGRPYLVYEFVESGRTLEDALREGSLAERVGQIRDVAGALGHAHRAGVVHRDVKPSNVLIDGAGRIRLADFGLAVAEGDDRLTRTGELVGTPQYMAPEQLTGQVGAETPATDVWALGVMLYEALTGQVPFEASSMLDLMATVTRQDPKRPSKLAPETPRALEEVCLRALRRDPTERFADGDAFVAALDAGLSGQRPARPARRGALGIALAAGAILVWGIAFALSAGHDPRERTSSALGIDGAAPDRAAPADPLVVAERLLEAGDEAGAFDTLQGREKPAAALLRGEALFCLDRLSEARRELAGAAPSKRKTRIEGLILVLEGKFREARALLSASADLRAVIAETDRRALADSVANYVIPTDGSRGLVGPEVRRLQRLVKRVAIAVAELGRLGRPFGKRFQATIVDACVNFATVVRPDRDDDALRQVLRSVVVLYPRKARQLGWVQAWVLYHDRDRERAAGFGDLIPEDPTPWVDASEPRTAGTALGLWFLRGAVPKGRLARRAAGERSLELASLPGATWHFRGALRVALANVYRDRAYSTLRSRGDGSADIALAHAHLRAAADEEARYPDDGRAALALVYLLEKRIAAARAMGPRISAPRVRFLIEVECELVERNRGRARRFLEESPYTEEDRSLLMARGHARLLTNAPRLAREDFALAAKLPRPRIDVNWHRVENTKHLLGGGWWPGYKPSAGK